MTAPPSELAVVPSPVRIVRWWYEAGRHPHDLWRRAGMIGGWT
jgi:hypothetical protein